jgi:hypothetical protein
LAPPANYRASFRDPDGRVLRCDGRVLRLVAAESWPGLEAFLGSPIAQSLVETGKLVGTTTLARSTWDSVLDHPEVRVSVKELEV